MNKLFLSIIILSLYCSLKAADQTAHSKTPVHIKEEKTTSYLISLIKKGTFTEFNVRWDSLTQNPECSTNSLQWIASACLFELHRAPLTTNVCVLEQIDAKLSRAGGIHFGQAWKEIRENNSLARRRAKNLKFNSPDKLDLLPPHLKSSSVEKFTQKPTWIKLSGITPMPARHFHPENHCQL